VDEGEEAEGDERRLEQGGGLSHRHQVGVAALCPPERDHRLHQGEHGREDKREMSEFGEHARPYQRRVAVGTKSPGRPVGETA
jgi:hypothetical protein